MSEELKLSVNLSDDEINKIMNILLQSNGIRHYVLEDDKKNRFDVVEYSEYQKLEQELAKSKELYRKALENSVKLDRELMKYKEANKKAIEYIKEHKDEKCYFDKSEHVYKSNDDYLLEILEVDRRWIYGLEVKTEKNYIW